MIPKFQICSPRELRERGIVGMNQRNSGVIARYNDRRHYPRVDDKLKTKLLAREFGLNVPELYGVIRNQSELNRLHQTLSKHERFVIKPSNGSAGKGILVILGRDGDDFLKASGEKVSLQDIRRHVSNTISGLYSLGGRHDVAMLEYAIEFSDAFDGFSYQGVPDIRVIVFQGYPVMAMMRLSTKVSDGKANLHQGAVGVGIDLATGQAIRGVQFNHPITHHPDTGRALTELVIPRWQELIYLASQCYEVTELGYIGADIVLDKNLGPLILELNARPGLAIQVANDTGLKPRIDAIETLSRRDKIFASVLDRVAFTQREFSKPRQK